MEYNLLENIQYCAEFVADYTTLVNYSHLPVGIIVVLIGLFVYAKNRSLLSTIFLSMSTIFYLWTFFDWMIWMNFDKGSVIMYAWSPIELFTTLLFMLAFYFVYVFTKNKDIPFYLKVVFVLVLLPIIFLTPTDYNLDSYDIQECIALEGVGYITYVNIVQVVLGTLTIVFALWQSIKGTVGRAKNLIMLTGIGSFLYAFFISGYVAEKTGNFTYEVYGLFAMIIFVACLAYLIVRYHLFNFKLLGAQALVIALVSLVGSQFFFIESFINQILNAATLALVMFFGYFLVRSVEREVEHREKLQKLTVSLEKANTKLEQLNQLKSEFLSFASHQIRNPLSAVKGYASLLLQGDYGKVDDEPKQAIKTIFEASDSLVKMVQDFLDVSKIEQGGMKYQKETISLQKLVEQTSNELSPTATTKGLALNTHVKDGEYSIKADEVKLKQVLVNVIDNAIKYTPEGSVDVYLESKKDWVRVTVKDSGVGLEPDDLERLFAKFSRAKDAHKHNTHGSGLGMYLAKMIVEAHHGHIWAESEGKGKGTSFIIELKKTA